MNKNPILRICFLFTGPSHDFIFAPQNKIFVYSGWWRGACVIHHWLQSKPIRWWRWKLYSYKYLSYTSICEREREKVQAVYIISELIACEKNEAEVLDQILIIIKIDLLQEMRHTNITWWPIKREREKSG